MKRGLAVRRSPVMMLALGAALALGAGTAAAARPKPPDWVLHGPYAPMIDPSNFVTRIDNRYFPLAPGTAFHYRGFSDTTAQSDDMVVTSRHKRILGVECTVVRDTVSEHSRPIERTFDWYAQDMQGNVWYMGEKSLERKHGVFVLASDSWQAGVNGAEPGIIMQGDPKRGDVYRQEFYPPGGALDQARVLGFRDQMGVGRQTYRHVLVTIEWSPVEPQLEKKWYAAGIGEIQEQVVAGGHERFQLVSVTR
jgi:hypothetical protein